MLRGTFFRSRPPILREGGESASSVTIVVSKTTPLRASKPAEARPTSNPAFARYAIWTALRRGGGMRWRQLQWDDGQLCDGQSKHAPTLIPIVLGYEFNDSATNRL